MIKYKKSMRERINTLLDADKQLTNIHTDRYNYSIAFIKSFLSFCVVCCHYWCAESAEPYLIAMMYRMRAAAVPIYILMSFYLTERTFSNASSDKIKKRAWRLLFPYFSWAILYFYGYRIINVLLKVAGLEQGLKISFNKYDLLWQMAFGSDRYLCPQLWYQFDLIVFTALFWIVFRYLPKVAWKISVIVGVLALYLQYSGINYKLFGEYENEVRWSTGRLAEVLPLACIGLLFAHTMCLEGLKKHRLYVMCLCVLSLLVVAYGGLFTVPQEGFGYGGTYIIAYATVAFVLFYMIPFERLPQLMKKILKVLSRFSFGVFCIHFGVGYCWNKVLCPRFGWKINSFIECIWIYLICIFTSWIISLIPIKYAKQLVE